MIHHFSGPFSWWWRGSNIYMYRCFSYGTRLIQCWNFVSYMLEHDPGSLAGIRNIRIRILINHQVMLFWVPWNVTSNCCSLWIQVPPKKILYRLYPPNCTLSAFLAADPWIHRGWFFVVVSKRLLLLDVSRCEVKHPGCWVFPRNRGGETQAFGMQPPRCGVVWNIQGFWHVDFPTSKNMVILGHSLTLRGEHVAQRIHGTGHIYLHLPWIVPVPCNIYLHLIYHVSW